MSYELHTVWSPGLIVASYAIAVLGSATCLQLVKERHKETSSKQSMIAPARRRGSLFNGQRYDAEAQQESPNKPNSNKSKLLLLERAQRWRELMFLISGGVSLGACAIFAMHFCGMLALSVYDKDSNGEFTVLREIRYDAGLTVLSLFVAIIIVSAGLWIANKPVLWKQIGAGVIGGLGVGAMHYTGMEAMVMQAHMRYDAGIVVTSIIVGIIAATVALLLFFRFSEYWSSSIIFQLLTAMVMGVAVCAMHYCGMFAATYYPMEETVDLSAYTSSSTLIAVIIPLAVLTCGVLGGFMLVRYRQLLLAEAAKSQYLTLTALCVDSNGHILTNFADSLPSVVIDTHYGGKGDFDQMNVDFLRLLKASFNWSSLDRSYSHLCELVRQGKCSTYSPELFTRFSEAAHQLAEVLGVRLESLGPLYWQPSGTQLTVIVSPMTLKPRHLHSHSLKFSTPTVFIKACKLPIALDAKGRQLPHTAVHHPLNEWLETVHEYGRRLKLPIIRTDTSDELQNFLRTVGQELMSESEQQEIEQEILAWRKALGKYVKTKYHLSMLSQATEHWKTVPLDPMVKVAVESTLNQTRKRDNDVMRAARDSEASKLILALYYVQVTSCGLRVLIHDDSANHFIPAVRFSHGTVIAPDDLNWLRASSRKKNVFTADLVKNPKLLQPQNPRNTNSISTAPAAAASNNGRAGNNPNSFKFHNKDNPEQDRPFRDELLLGMQQLAELLGSSKDLTLSNLYMDGTLGVGNGEVQVLPFVVCSFNAALPAEYTAAGLRSVPLPVFEILHFSRNPATKTGAMKWTRALIDRQLQQHGKQHILNIDNSSLGGNRDSGSDELERQTLYASPVRSPSQHRLAELSPLSKDTLTITAASNLKLRTSYDIGVDSAAASSPSHGPLLTDSGISSGATLNVRRAALPPKVSPARHSIRLTAGQLSSDISATIAAAAAANASNARMSIHKNRQQTFSLAVASPRDVLPSTEESPSQTTDNINSIIRRSYADNNSLDVYQPSAGQQGRLKSVDSCTINIPESTDHCDSMKAESEQPIAA